MIWKKEQLLYLLLDYDDYEDDIKIEKSVAEYLAFVKSKRNSVHYLV